VGSTTNLEQTANRIVFQTSSGPTGVYSVPKAGGSVAGIAVDTTTPPAVNFLDATDSGRVYVTYVEPGGTPENIALAFLDDGTAVTTFPDAHWAGEAFQTSCDFAATCEDSIGAQALFVRHGAAGTSADIEIVDTATSLGTGNFFNQIINVASGKAVFAVGFGQRPQFTFLSVLGDTDIWLGDSLAAGPGGPAGSLALVSNDVSGDDRWLLFGTDDGGGAGPGSCTTPPAGLIGWYPGDGNAFDIQGGRHGTPNGGVSFATGRVDQAFSFDGATGVVQVPSGPSLPTPSGITLDAWVNFSSAGGNQMIVTRDLSGLGEAYVLLRNGNTLEADAHDSAGNGTPVTFAFVPTPGTWYHVAYAFDDASNSQTLYLDGALVAGNTNASLIGYDLSSMTIGADVEPGPTTLSYFNGSIDEVEMFDRALTQPEIQAIFSAGAAGKCKPGGATDFDNDGLSFALEMSLGTNPNSADTDNDGLDDAAEISVVNPGAYDPGVDTDPRNGDTDGDGVGDGLEVALNSAPLVGNAAIRVSGGGNDGNTGATWDDVPAGTGPVLTNARAVQLLDLAQPYPPDEAGQFFVLYDDSASPGPLDFADGLVARQYVSFIGSLGPTRNLPMYPPTTSFDAGGSGRPLTVSNALNITVRNVEITNGSVIAPEMGGGVLLSDADGVASLVLDRVWVTSNTAEQGGGIAALGDSEQLQVRNSEIKFNTASSGTTGGQGGGIYIDDAGFNVQDTRVLNNNALGPSTGPGQGGGMYVTQSFGTIVNSEFRDNLSNTTGSGGGGGALYVAPGATATNVTVNDSKFIDNTANGGPAAATHGGGAINVQGAGPTVIVTIERSLFAGNRGNNGPGGAINLIDVGVSTVRDNMFLANSSLRPGGGLHLHPTGPAEIFNNLFIGNVSTDTVTDGGAVEIENLVSDPNVNFNSNTVAWNQTPNNASDAGGGVSFSVFVNFHNNIAWFNQNSSPGTTDAGDNMRFDGSVGASANNVEDPGMPGSTPTLPRFQQGFYLDPVTPSQSVDTGDNAFAGPLLGAPYTTHPNGSPDATPVDIGFHYRQPSAGAMISVADAPLFSCSVNAVVFRPVFANAASGEPGHLIAAEFSGVGGTMDSLTTIAPRGGSSRMARDLGDGRYAVNVSGAGSGTATFTIYADDQATPQTFQVEFDGGC
ncbi:MAG: LamG domain-containing protein, partial [Gammaproteobacteria bacterium]